MIDIAWLSQSFGFLYWGRKASLYKRWSMMALTFFLSQPQSFGSKYPESFVMGILWLIYVLKWRIWLDWVQVQPCRVWGKTSLIHDFSPVLLFLIFITYSLNRYYQESGLTVTVRIGLFVSTTIPLLLQEVLPLCIPVKPLCFNSPDHHYPSDPTIAVKLPSVPLIAWGHLRSSRHGDKL